MTSVKRTKGSQALTTGCKEEAGGKAPSGRNVIYIEKWRTQRRGGDFESRLSLELD